MSSSLIQETFTIGGLIRQEVEVVQGSTLELLVPVVGGTAGKTFTATFQHDSYVSPTVPTPVLGLDLAGSFVVAVATSQSVKLTTTTGSLLAGRYLYSVISTLSSVVNTSVLREFVVLPALLSNVGSVLPLPSTAAQLIAQHNIDLSAHGGFTGGGGGSTSAFSAEFSQVSLNTAGILMLLHGLAKRPATVSVFDNSGHQVAQSDTVTNATAFSVDLTDFQPITGTWLVIASL